VRLPEKFSGREEWYVRAVQKERSRKSTLGQASALRDVLSQMQASFERGHKKRNSYSFRGAIRPPKTLKYISRA